MRSGASLAGHEPARRHLEEGPLALIDHTVVEFRPIDFTDLPGGMHPLSHFSHFELAGIHSTSSR